jgi:hypothetical protein
MSSFKKDEKVPTSQHSDTKENKEQEVKSDKLGSNVHTHVDHTANPLQKVAAVDAPISESSLEKNQVSIHAMPGEKQ